LFAQLGIAELDAGVLERIDELEQLGKPAAQMHTRLPAAAIVLGHGAEGIDVRGRRGDISRSSFSTIGEDGAVVEMAAGAATRGLAALATQAIERAGQKGRPFKAGLEQAGQELLGLSELLAQRTQMLGHRRSRGAGPLCRLPAQSCYRNPADVAKIRKKGKNDQDA
jgi:hypothetical protein